MKNKLFKFKPQSKLTVELIEEYLKDHYPHLFKLTTRKEIKEWVEMYEKTKENELQ